jgi:hypothetical protein
MGMFMGIDDMYIEGLIETLNLRFGIYPDVPDSGADTLNADENLMQLNASGIREVQAIQAATELFKANRPLVQSLRTLGVGGEWNPQMRRKWLKLLNRLDTMPSNDPTGLSGGKAIVAAMMEHLRLQNVDPDPVHFKTHDSRSQQGGARVLITKGDRPVFYIDRTFLTISIPMTPRFQTAPPGPPTP